MKNQFKVNFRDVWNRAKDSAVFKYSRALKSSGLEMPLTPRC